jgi:CheY-like chemotaxis protein
MVSVLVVDDDDAIRLVMRTVLEDAGHLVQEAPDGEVALALLRQSPVPLVVVLDLLMPRMDGVAVLRRAPVEGESLRRHAYVVSTAASRALPTVQPILEAVGARVLLRPFDVDVLTRIVAEAAQSLDVCTIRRTAERRQEDRALPWVEAGVEPPEVANSFVMPLKSGAAAFQAVPDVELELVLNMVPTLDSRGVWWSDRLRQWEILLARLRETSGHIGSARALLDETALRTHRPLP